MQIRDNLYIRVIGQGGEDASMKYKRMRNYIGTQIKHEKNNILGKLYFVNYINNSKNPTVMWNKLKLSNRHNT